MVITITKSNITALNIVIKRSSFIITMIIYYIIVEIEIIAIKVIIINFIKIRIYLI